MDWRERAACRAVDPELFFPVGTSPGAMTQASRAGAVCQTCAVREPCLEFAVDTGQVDGVWGGLYDVALRRLVTRGRREKRALAASSRDAGPD